MSVSFNARWSSETLHIVVVGFCALQEEGKRPRYAIAVKKSFLFVTVAETKNVSVVITPL